MIKNRFVSGFFYFWRMKKLCISLILILSIHCLNAQETNLIGKWKVSCPAERKNSSELHMCDLCPTTMLNNNTAIVEEFELEFTKEEIKIQHEEVPIGIVYKYETENNSISFRYLGKTYMFKILLMTDPKVNILVAETGEVLYLKKL